MIFRALHFSAHSNRRDKHTGSNRKRQIRSHPAPSASVGIPRRLLEHFYLPNKLKDPRYPLKKLPDKSATRFYISYISFLPDRLLYCFIHSFQPRPSLRDRWWAVNCSLDSLAVCSCTVRRRVLCFVHNLARQRTVCAFRTKTRSDIGFSSRHFRYFITKCHVPVRLKDVSGMRIVSAVHTIEDNAILS